MARKFVDDNALTYIIQKIKLWDNGKVDKENGKSLIADTEIARLANVTNYDDTSLQSAVSGKVDKETGKSLISDSEIARLANVTNYDDTALAAAVAGKTTLAAVQELGYQTASDVSTAIQTALAGFAGISFSVVSSLPASGTAGVFYLVPNSGSGTNGYDEYVWVTIPGDPATERFEKIGTTDIDLSGYMQTSDMVAITNAEIDAIITPAS